MTTLKYEDSSDLVYAIYRLDPLVYNAYTGPLLMEGFFYPYDLARIVA